MPPGWGPVGQVQALSRLQCEHSPVSQLPAALWELLPWLTGLADSTWACAPACRQMLCPSGDKLASAVSGLAQLPLTTGC